MGEVSIPLGSCVGLTEAPKAKPGNISTQCLHLLGLMKSSQIYI